MSKSLISDFHVPRVTLALALAEQTRRVRGGNGTRGDAA